MATVDGGASVDAATSLGPSCISRLYGTYIVRPDGILIWENDPSSPEPIIDASTGDPLTGIVNVQEGQYHGCAALTDGSAKCWQTDPVNGSVAGQLGNGTTTATSALYRATPVLTAAATPLTNIVAIAPGDDESDNGCAVTGDGKLWCWGDLTWLANSGTTLHTGYAQVITTDGTTPLTGVASAVIGSGQACVLRTGSSSGVWCWGRNGEGELGQGDTTSRAYPTEVLGLAAPSKLAISYGTVVNAGDVICALDGANVKCWGDNPFGGVGSNTTTNPVLSPTYVVTQSGSLLGNVTDIQGGNDCEFAVLRSDGSLWTWGYDFQIYAASYEVADAGVTGVLAIGWAGPPAFGGPRYVTGDGVYHSGTSAVSVDCNAM
jgi:alpha-tubulin suppressor-like RCC1 family protein